LEEKLFAYENLGIPKPPESTSGKTAFTKLCSKDTIIHCALKIVQIRTENGISGFVNRAPITLSLGAYCKVRGSVVQFVITVFLVAFEYRRM
jgi:hypothetical protein